MVIDGSNFSPTEVCTASEPAEDPNSHEDDFWLRRASSYKPAGCHLANSTDYRQQTSWRALAESRSAA